ncbi:MAG TPA: hypothetical protein VHG08_01125 [Longimicrobium sp.]|nr:hypothetical protein [Longimicrobium sp.]
METDTLLAISLIGFGVQQFLQVVADPIASVIISSRSQPVPGNGGLKVLPGGISDTDAKKAFMGLLSFFLGLFIVLSAGKDLLLLQALQLEPLPPRWLDVFVSALTIAAGTEGANSVLKLLQYAKDAVKLRTPERGAQDSPVRPERLGLAGRAGAEEADVDETPNLGDDAAAVAETEGDPVPAGTRMTEPAAERTEKSADEAELATAAAVSWRAAECLLKLRAQVNQRAPNRSKRADGLIGDAAHARRTSDHNPWVRDGGRGVVTAIDITHDPARNCDAGKIAEAIRVSQDPRVKYIIFNRRIASSAPRGGRPAWAWRPYSGANPHTSHVHISVQPEKRLYDSTDAWKL